MLEEKYERSKDQGDGPMHIRRNRISSRTVNEKDGTSAHLECWGCSREARIIMEVWERGSKEGTERRDSWYLTRVPLDRQYFYCFVVNTNKTV